MLSQNQGKILKLLLTENDSIQLKELQQMLKISEKTIREAIKDINSQILLIQSSRFRGFYIRKEDKNKAIEVLEKQNETGYPQSPRERQNFMAIQLLISFKPVSLSYLSELFFVSKTTANNDMNHVINWFSKQNVSVEINTKGHFIKLNNEERKLLLVFMLTENFNNFFKAQKVLEFSFSHVVDYEKLVKTIIGILIELKIRTSDANVFFFINYIAVTQEFSKNKALKASIFKMGTTDHVIYNKLQKSLDLNNIDWSSICNMYDMMILNLYSETDYELAKIMVQKFIAQSFEDYQVTLSKNKEEELIHIISIFIRDHRLMIKKNVESIEQIKKTYPYCYEVSRIFLKLFKLESIFLSEEELVLLSLYMNSILVLEETKIQLFLICDLDIIILNHILSALKKTINSSLVTLNSLTFYEFKDRAEIFNKKASIILDAGTNAQSICNKFDLPYLHLNPLFFRKDIDRINKLIVETNISRRNNQKIIAIKSIENIINFRIIDEKEFERVKKKSIKDDYYIETNKRIIQLKNNRNKMNMYVLRKQNSVEYVLIYSVDKNNLVLSKNIILVESFIKKYLSLTKIVNCKNKNDFIQLLYDSCT